jgi:hypothetical protein
MPQWSFVRQQFNRGDSMSIPERGLTFIRVAPHFYGGRLTISVADFSTVVNFSATAGSAYVFENRPILISYSNSSNFPCEVTIWKIHSGCRYAFYSRNFRDGRIYANVEDRDFQVCWFLQFPGDVKLTLVEYERSEGIVEILRMNGSETAPLGFSPKAHVLRQSTFAVVAGPHAAFHLDVESQSPAFDWDDREGYFADCRKSLDCQQNTSAVTAYIGYVNRRPLDGWYVGVVVVAALTLVIVTVMLFWDATSEFSMGSGMKPLGKILPLPFT